AGSCAGSTIVTRTWTATDACGNSVSHVQTITVEDTTAPSFVEALPANVTVSCDAVPAAVTLTATDSCGTATVTFTESEVVGSCAGSTIITRTWTATDACGNSVSHVQTITVEDTTAPSFVETLPVNVTVSCDAVPAAVTLTATDNCSEASVVYSESANTICVGSSVITRTWTASDLCGNTLVHTQIVTVQDNTPPTFTAPADIILVANENCTANTDPSITGNVTNIQDNCDPNPTATYTDSDCIGNSNGGSLNAGNGNYFYFNVSGFDTLSASDIQKIALSFETNQGKGRAEFTLVAPSGQAVILVGPYCTGGFCDDPSPNIKELYLPVFYPNSSGYTQWDNNNFVPNGVSQNFTPNGALTSPNATMINGLTSYVSSFEQFTGPMNGTWFIYSRKQASVNGNIDFNSVCLTPAVGECASNQLIIRHWTVSDSCGNSVEFDQTIQIIDSTPPVFVGDLPQDITVQCDAIPAAATLTATDNCGNVEVVYTESVEAGQCLGSSVITRTWTATDTCGNSVSHVQTITVEDTAAPVFVGDLPQDITVECDAIPEVAILTATDNCGDVEITFAESVATGQCLGSSVITRTWTATDSCGNTTSHVQVITSEDTTAPVFVGDLPQDITVECDAIPAAVTLTAVDNCGSVNVVYYQTILPGDCPQSYSIIRLWSATDSCGNTAIKKQIITVVDTIAPVFVEELPQDITVECNNIPSAVVLTATDNCSIPTVTFSEVTSAGNCSGSSVITRTWTATDSCGNVTTHIQVVTVEDTTAPVFVGDLPQDITVECDAIPAVAIVSATNSCSDVTLTFNETIIEGSCLGSYNIIRTWTATDDCGNSISHSQTITVEDTTAPVFVGDLPQNATVQCDAIPAAVTLTATDNCGDATVTFNES
ncbi:HYR-like domain-containing protein, partial [Flavobacterium orientale]|uniref:HYR-like domain-containing protein n=1 Tax=Flavobacterium orientale TaxID=1756020 RepID=UPI001668A370